jgi:hypothetical protein
MSLGINNAKKKIGKEIQNYQLELSEKPKKHVSNAFK